MGNLKTLLKSKKLEGENYAAFAERLSKEYKANITATDVYMILSGRRPWSPKLGGILGEPKQSRKRMCFDVKDEDERKRYMKMIRAHGHNTLKEFMERSLYLWEMGIHEDDSGWS